MVEGGGSKTYDKVRKWLVLDKEHMEGVLQTNIQFKQNWTFQIILCSILFMRLCCYYYFWFFFFFFSASHVLLNRITDVCIEYLVEQVKAGAQVITK
jgi:uroporphyrinogen-III decarboxylase